MKKTITLTLICLCFAVGNGSAQRDTALISKNLELAQQLMDRGLYGESIALLDATEMHDTDKTALYPYEKAFAYYMQQDYDEAITELRKAARMRDASDNVYRMLGDCYLFTGELDEAFKAYDRGLGKFPYSGRLYYSMGGLHFNLNRHSFALDSFLEGIARDPAFAPNWFGAAIIQFSDGDKAFGMVNGETAICLEPDSRRSEYMSETLLETYRENISLPEGTVVETSFANETVVFWRVVLKENSPYFPFDYAENLESAVGATKTLDIPSLISIRRKFIELWFSTKKNEKWPCALFDYHRALIDEGHFEAYNYWLFASVDTTAFDVWRFGNAGAFDAFKAWFIENPIFKP